MTQPVTTPGRLVAGRYRLLSQLGGGGMGTVWRARDELLGREVALKQVLPPAGTDPQVVEQQRERALREGRIAARLSHPHAISVYDVALENGSPWLVMEYLPSRSLATVLTEDGILRVDQVAQIGAQVADALAATHAAGIVHRDVKPANILIGQGPGVQGLVKITDFGISHASGDVTLTQTGQITGTPAFLAPEVAQGSEMTEASDVYSLGATLYTCLEGHPPFGMDENALRLLHRIAGGQFDPPRAAGAITQPLLRMLAPDPAARPSMVQVRDDLAKLAAGRDGDTTTVLLARTDLRPAAPDRARTATMAAGAGAGAAAAGAVAAAAAGPAADAAAGSAPPTPRSSPPGPDRTLVNADGGQLPPGTPQSGAPASDPPPRRSRVALWLAAAAVVALLATLGVWLSTQGDPGGSAAGTSAPATSRTAEPTTDAAATPSAASSAESTSEEAPSTEETTQNATTPPVDPAGDTPEQTLATYYSLLPGDTEGAYAMTGPYLRSVASYAYYEDFFSPWAEVSLLEVRDVQESGDGYTATTVVEFVAPDGDRQVEQHAVRFVSGEDGGLLIDRDVLVATVG